MRHFVRVFVLVGLIVTVYAGDQLYQHIERIACYPNRQSPVSKGACLARSCLFDDKALPNEIQCYTVKTNRDIMTVELPDIIKADPKYRIDCSPDIDEYRSFCVLNLSNNRTLNTTNESCTARGCVWDSSAELGITTCYIPVEKGGYGLIGEINQLSNAITQYTLTRLSTKPSHIRSMTSVESMNSANEFSIFNHDIDNLDVQVSISGPDMMRMTIRDATAQRYEVPVPIQWNPSTPSSVPARIKFEMTKTVNGQVGFRVQRTNKQSILFDTSFFANGFVYDDKFIQIITTIPSRNVYGKFRMKYFN
jgi:hypothetical protein